MRWATVELGEVCVFLSGFAFKSDLFSTEPNGLPVIRIRDVLPGSSKTFYSGDYQSQYIVERGDILIGMDGEFNRERWKSDPALLNQRVCKAIARANILDDGYLYHALPMLLKKIEDETPFVTVKHLSVAKLKSAQIPLPPLEEQRHIAAILDKTAEISSANRQRKDLLRALPLSVYRQMLGDPRHNPFQWPVFRLGEICLNEDARRVPVKSSDRKAMQGRFPYYGASGVIDHVDDYLFDGQRLLVGEDGANLIARSSPIAFIADGKYWVNNHAHVLSENGRAKLRFLEYYFALVDLKPFVTGSAQPKLTRSALDSLPVPLPPLDLQERFESVLTALDARFAQAEISAQQTSSLSYALRSASFQGDAG
jgi:type I restriction enzyme S subunit